MTSQRKMEIDDVIFLLAQARLVTLDEEDFHDSQEVRMLTLSDDVELVTWCRRTAAVADKEVFRDGGLTVATARSGMRPISACAHAAHLQPFVDVFRQRSRCPSHVRRCPAAATKGIDDGGPRSYRQAILGRSSRQFGRVEGDNEVGCEEQSVGHCC